MEDQDRTGTPLRDILTRHQDRVSRKILAEEGPRTPEEEAAIAEDNARASLLHARDVARHLGRPFTGDIAAADLSPRDLEVMNLRYGFAGRSPHTLAEIAAIFGLSPERIRQILHRAERKVRETGERDA